MLNYFKFNGKISLDYGILIRNKQSYNAPEREIEVVSVPGRDGDIIFDKGNYKNIDISYGIAIAAGRIIDSNRNIDMATAINRFNEWVYNAQGKYYMLQDTYDPDYYKMGYIKGGLSWETKSTNFATSQITFSCKPYRYSVDSDVYNIYATKSKTLQIENPEQFSSLPTLYLYGRTSNCGFKLNGVNRIFDMSSASNIDYIIIDSEEMQITRQDGNPFAGSYTTTGSYFPQLQLGNNNFELIGNTTRLSIIPRWRRI